MADESFPQLQEQFRAESVNGAATEWTDSYGGAVQYGLQQINHRGWERFTVVKSYVLKPFGTAGEA